MYFFSASLYSKIQLVVHRKATDLFESTDEALEFLEDTPFDVEKAFLLESAGKVCEAAELYRNDRPLHAAYLFLQDVDSERSVNRARECLLSGMWKVFAYGARIEDIGSGTVAAYLKLSTDFVNSDPDTAQSREVGDIISSINYELTWAEVSYVPCSCWKKIARVAITGWRIPTRRRRCGGFQMHAGYIPSSIPRNS